MTKITTENLLAILAPHFYINRVQRRSPYLECDSGWNDIIADIHSKIVILHPKYEIFQIKEKFGGLRFYIEGVPDELFDEIYDIIGDGEKLSYKTCEICGDEGKLSKLGWLVKTVCKNCFDKKIVSVTDSDKFEYDIRPLVNND
jgi:hypothetical protein